MYDLFLYSSCQSLPPLTDLAEDIPALADSSFQQRLITSADQAPGWLGLELERALAHALLKRLRVRNAEGLIALSEYHQPARITLEQAIQTARPFLAELAEWHNIYPIAPFESKEMHHLSPMCWVIFAWEEREGARRPRPSVAIDKLDGHLWTDGEMNLLHGL